MERIIMDKTLEVLPKEGEIEQETFRWVRRPCSGCGEPAHYKCTFLLEGCRGNPKSEAYGKDDCSWCEDACKFACNEHLVEVRQTPPDGMVECTTFPASARFAHMFLYKQSVPAAEEAV